jgi:hypothetical protein
MTDSDLNSCHLESSRRDDFRRAREALLEARGLQTLVLDQAGGPAGSQSHPIPQERRERQPAACWLRHRNGIYPLKPGVNTIGRLPDNDVVIPRPYASRRHCAILVHAGNRCEIHDVASKKGIYVNGIKVNGSTHLVSGDEIWMCRRRLVFLAGSP